MESHASSTRKIVLFTVIIVILGWEVAYGQGDIWSQGGISGVTGEIKRPPGWSITLQVVVLQNQQLYGKDKWTIGNAKGQLLYYRNGTKGSTNVGCQADRTQITQRYGQRSGYGKPTGMVVGSYQGRQMKYQFYNCGIPSPGGPVCWFNFTVNQMALVGCTLWVVTYCNWHSKYVESHHYCSFNIS